MSKVICTERYKYLGLYNGKPRKVESVKAGPPITVTISGGAATGKSELAAALHRYLVKRPWNGCVTIIQETTK